MKRLLVIISIVLLLLPFHGYTQEDASGEFQDGVLLEQIETEDGPLLQTSPLNGNSLSVGFSYQEVMEMLRSRVASAETENHLEVTQSGKDNSATVIMEGQGNAMDVTQRGNNNIYEGSLKGEENLIHILQTGYYNRLYQILEGNGMELQVTQQGSNLELIQIETGGNSPAYQVHQRGAGMSLTIEHNQVMLPLGGGN